MWILQSRKAQVAVWSIVSIVLSRLLTYLGFSPQEINTISTGIMIVASVWIASIAHEDASKLKAQNPPPAPQVNVGSDVTNLPPTTTMVEDKNVTDWPPKNTTTTPAPPPKVP